VVLALVVVAFVVWLQRPVVNVAPPAVAVESPGTETAGRLFVHVAGAVRSPGLFELPEGSRVADAVAAAGGARRGGVLDLLNLAQLLTDGMKVEVPRKGAQVASQGASPASGGPTLVSINGADTTALETIPGIGPVTAAAIIAHRDEIGGFTALEQLLDVSGIGPAKYEAMLPYVAL
jgi:competence protein ComEA